jgi:hypothetical protein
MVPPVATTPSAWEISTTANNEQIIMAAVIIADMIFIDLLFTLSAAWKNMSLIIQGSEKWLISDGSNKPS